MKRIIKLRNRPFSVYVGEPYRAFIKGLITFPYNFIRGKLYGYPTCCVLYYCILNMTELPASASKETFEYIETGKEYAECPACLIKL